MAGMLDWVLSPWVDNYLSDMTFDHHKPVSIVKAVVIRGISATGRRRTFKIMLKHSSETHNASHNKPFLHLLADCQMSANPRTSHWRHPANQWRSVYAHDKGDYSLCSTPWIRQTINAYWTCMLKILKKIRPTLTHISVEPYLSSNRNSMRIYLL